MVLTVLAATLVMTIAYVIYTLFGLSILITTVMMSIFTVGFFVTECYLAHDIDKSIPGLSTLKDGSYLVRTVVFLAMILSSVIFCITACSYFSDDILYFGLLGMVVYLSYGFCCGYSDSLTHQFLLGYGIIQFLFEGVLVLVALLLGMRLDFLPFIMAVAVGVILALIRAFSFGDMLLFLGAVFLETYLWNGTCALFVSLCGIFFACLFCSIRILFEKLISKKVQFINYLGKGGYVRFSLELVMGQAVSMCIMSGFVALALL